MITFLKLILEFMGIVLAAELVAGLVHWFEDAYVREDTPLIGRLIGRPNVIHHHVPRYMTRHSWWQSSWDLLLIAGLLLFIAWCLDCLSWQVGLFACLAANANEFHKWSHRTRQENGRLISCLQDIHILQTAKHHARHHTDPKNSHYCTITNILNPVLDGLHFWDGLEWLLAMTIQLKRRPDTSVRGMGPDPSWLAAYRQKPAGSGIRPDGSRVKSDLFGRDQDGRASSS